MINGVMSMIFFSSMMFNNLQINVKDMESIDKELTTIICENLKEEYTENILHVTLENFEEEVLNSNKVVLVDFYAEWCKPCQKLSPIISKLYQTEIDLKVVKVDGPSQIQLKEKYSVNAYPTMIFFKDGKEVKRLVGYKKYEILKEEIEKIMQGI